MGGEKVWWKIWQSIPLYLKLPMIIFCQFWAVPPPPIVLLYGAPFPHHFRDVPPPLLLSVQRTGIQLVSCIVNVHKCQVGCSACFL